MATGKSAATAEVAGKKRSITISSKKFDLPASVKAGLWRQMVTAQESGNSDAMVAVLEAVLGPEQSKRFWEIDVPLNGHGIVDAFDEFLGEAITKILGTYGTSAGE